MVPGIPADILGLKCDLCGGVAKLVSEINKTCEW